MLSFKELSEKKTKIKLNPKQSEITEKKSCNHTKKGLMCPMHGMKPCPDTTNNGEGDGGMEEGYKGYSKGGEVEPPKERLKTDRNMFNIPKGEQDAARERLKAKAAAKRKQLNKEEQAYVSQEEVSEESDQSIDQEETSLLTFSQFDERTRYAKETGKDPQTGNPSEKGGTMKGSAMAAVRKDLVKSGGLMSSRKKAINPQGKKKEKGVKSDVGTGKYKKMADNKKAQADKVKKAGFKDKQSYADTMARYGGEDNYKKGRGLGS